MNRNVAIFLALTAVVILGVGSALTGLGGSAVNRWTLMGAVLVVLALSRLVVGALDRRGRGSRTGGPADPEP